MNEVLRQYAENLKHINELSEQNKALQTVIINELNKAGKAIKTEVGTFARVVRKAYSFTENVTGWRLPDEILAKKKVVEEEEKEALKVLEEIKNKEIETGAAEVKVSVSMRFTPKKD